MTEEKSKEMFIPYRRADVIEMCLDDGQLDEVSQTKFKTFCEILTAYYHYRFHSVLECLKDCFAPANPDTHFKHYHPPSKREELDRIGGFYSDFEHLLEKANFRPLGQEDLERAFRDQTLIHLSIDVDFDAFDRYLFYYRGSASSTTMRKKMKFINKKVEFDIFERIVLLLKYKDKTYFEKKGMKLDKLRFTPGCTYIYYYKNVPKADLEILFPNVKISMTMKDRLMFFVPAIGLGLTAIIKVLPQIVALIAVILIVFKLPSVLEWLNIDKDAIPKDTLLTLTAVVFPIIIALGGFAVKQYLNYKNKWVEFLNDVTQTLFFRNISVNASVFQTLIDDAEEEECKEAILAYYHLLTAPEGLTKPDLDARIESWFKKKFDTHLDFDVEDALEKLERLSGRICTCGPRDETAEETPLISRDEAGRCRVQSLDDAIKILDSIWDHIYQT